jgi:hypothetical protein
MSKEKIVSLVKEAFEEKRRFAETFGGLQNSIHDEINAIYKNGDREVIPYSEGVGLKVEKNGDTAKDCSFVLVKL